MYLTIAICDDDHVQVDLIYKYILKSPIKRYDKEIIKTYEGEKLLEIIRCKKIDIIFLDIEMKGMNGIEVAREIRKINDEIVIIFLTGYKGYALDAFSVKSLDYVIKPIYEDEFNITLDKALRRVDESRAYKGKNDYFVVRNKDEIIRLKYDEIFFFEKQQRKIKIYSHKGNFMFNGTIRDLECQLEDVCFLQCHQGYLVNMNKLFLFRKDEIFFRDIEKTVPVSRRYKKSVVMQLEKQLI
ncbi:LytR/AlgR family response regulator transcription factor [Serpentinicella alkaliphila]|uniref:Stage 0 sporulation protein A homolog n=1 Tax=Serpentinicella alkaliphila TaxID=1734049 RepID=A0A4R2TLI9_9FIRM|nr:LytTR family DNA-binding domain-containing protein [Serpentinicella alkaliphila]QUH24716.1 response regulator transcription factor [Serpentinicella alkaliphila]TCQ03706.1 LytTR family two component transcriptional regulator [Serpentinicella alkaliphila]